MTEKESIKRKAEKLNSDIYSEDLELLNQTITEKTLGSRKDGLHFWANIIRGTPNSEKTQICQYRFGCFCTNSPEPQKKLRKTTDEYCQACIQAQKNKALQDESIEMQQVLFDLCHVPESYHTYPFNKWIIIVEHIDTLNFEIEELKRPLEPQIAEAVEDKISEIKKQFETEKTELLKKEQQNHITLDTDNRYLNEENQTLTAKLEDLKASQEAQLKKIADLATLETDNAFLNKENKALTQELVKLKAEPLAEKSAWQTIELNNAKEELKKANAKIAEQEKIISLYMFQQGKTP